MASLDALVDVLDAESDRQGWNLVPSPPRHVVLFFETEPGYEQAAKVFNAGGVSRSGFYAPAHLCSIFFDVRNSRDAMTAASQFHQAQTAIGQLIEESKKARRAGATAKADQLIGKARAEERRIQSELERITGEMLQQLTSIVTHEGAHQLLFERGIQTHASMYPLWVAEGLAVCFEGTSTDEPFGPSARSAKREAAWAELVRSDRPDLLPIIVTRTAPPTEQTDRERFYAESGALVGWMLDHRRTELAHFLEWFRTEGRGRRLAGNQLVEVFERFFGPIAVLERSWQRFELRRLRGTSVSRWAVDLVANTVPDVRVDIRAAAEAAAGTVPSPDSPTEPTPSEPGAPAETPPTPPQ